ncbi:hypothetical protein ACWFNE_06775 [Cellulomonas sp. NPDC055163]
MTQSYYLGPVQRTVVVSSWAAEIELAATAGVLDETRSSASQP